MELLKKDEEETSVLVQLITYALLGIHFTLNFMGSPLLKWLYLIECLGVLYCIARYDWKQILLPMIGLCFIEGQGRVLWSYSSWSRVFFDFCLILCFLKNAIKTKRFFPREKLPRFFTILIALHFLWYFIQLFNIKSVGFFGVLAASKIYIAPFLIFFLFLDNPFGLKEQKIIEIRRIICFLFIAEGFLSIHQMSMGEEFLYQISSYYKVQTKDVFVETAFRPFATSHLPGAMSTYFMLAVPLLYLVPIGNNIERVFIFFATIISLFCLFIMQVRTSLIKEVLMLAVIYGVALFNTKERIKFLIKTGIGIFMMSIIWAMTPSLDKVFPDINFDVSTNRLLELGKVEKLKSQRASPSLFMSVITKKLRDNPFGLGPGRTGAASGLSAGIIKNDPLHGIDYSWTHDNLYISLAIDLGIGMLFYLLAIGALPIYLIVMAFKYYDIYALKFRVILISSILPIVLILGNWGAIGIPYNPESFFFWFWCSIGLGQLYSKIQGELST